MVKKEVQAAASAQAQHNLVNNDEAMIYIEMMFLWPVQSETGNNVSDLYIFPGWCQPVPIFSFS